MTINAIIMCVRPGPSATAITIAMTRAGSEKITSVNLISNSSKSPPLKAATAPIDAPTHIAKATTQKLTTRSFGTLTITLLKTSRPKKSVPTNGPLKERPVTTQRFVVEDRKV